ncbi:PhzF family phenazine biosynthesis protein [Streptomyces clavuligerus]|uniref:Phenazine biosynthesis protein n=1 Tax=Streptomyces clavuligerus TaxID=1901 RepID=B5GZ01_STRCL|nr:PhzF family phenazine biosynthesis protein [Streptomyces clavuligerus]ANW21211.1 oxidoreductase [Streptomyces clavuligerus]AXU15836.1 PhzF family phenazine biosynthesis protein [Streptomyces clavuligerus]EDY51547.1 phenazine biosynthesis protein [Streptomyces clavuligerus]EFG05680.1 Phenazine biosynthesis protein [Streptomyces clavuligerus]MBY6305959.1 PhzF family phenazine biosynthesis protein [Streptomyces clavuligerus]
MRIRIVDAFTDTPFTGNPAAVVLLPDATAFPEPGWLQDVAREVNLSETAFAHPLPAGGDADWALRWFTPAVEVDLCGHATLATAHVLHTSGIAGGTVRFASRSGVLRTTAHEDGAITLDFPTSPLTPRPTPEGLAQTLGAPVVSAHDTGPHLGDLLVELADERTVRDLAPDLRALTAYAARGVVVTAAAERPDLPYDFVSRGFFPRAGIDEDPVTGSAHTALAPFWSARLGRAELTGLQASARSGLVRTELAGERTLLGGRAVTVVDGELLTRP